LHHIALPALSLPNAAVLAAAGVACGYAAIQIGRALLARRWPTVEGEIVDARVVRLNDESVKGLDGFVTYRYHVGGQPYTNTRVRFGPQLTPTSIVPARDTTSILGASLAASYPRGKPVRVYYNPRRPEDSVLYPAPDLRVWVLLVAALSFGYAAVNGLL
jgi:hypothetical protein